LTDWLLIRRYVDEGSQTAFADLVRRYGKLVYATCLRELGSPQLAEDATQAVFILLSTKARTFRQRQMLASWLFQAAILTSKTARRSEIRRRRREQQAMTAHESKTASGLSSDAEAHLNDALQRLPSTDREAVLLRFVDGAGYQDIGEALGVNENTARMRVTRSLDKMRRFFELNGVTLTAAALTAGLSEWFREAPAHIVDAAVHASHPSILSSSSIAHQIAQGASRSMKILQLKPFIAAAVIIAVTGSTAVAVRSAMPRQPYVALRPVTSIPTINPPPSISKSDTTFAGVSLNELMSDVFKYYGTPTTVTVGGNDDVKVWNSLNANPLGPDDTSIEWNYSLKDGRQLSIAIAQDAHVTMIAAGPDSGDTTARGAKVGMSRDEVTKLYGYPERQAAIVIGTIVMGYDDAHHTAFEFNHDTMTRIIIAK